MAQDMTGLFGPSPYDIQQARNQQSNDFAFKMANMDATQRGIYGMGKAGAGLANIGAGMMGMVDPAIAQAQQQQQILSQPEIDLQTSKGAFAAADKFRSMGDLNTAAKLLDRGRLLQKEEAAAAHVKTQEDLAERRFQEAEKVRIANEKQAKIDKLAADKERYERDAKNEALGIQERAAAERRADETKRMIAQMTYAFKQSQASSPETQKPRTQAQQDKYDKDLAQSNSAIRTQDMEIKNVSNIISDIVSSKGLGGATGVRGILPSWPGSNADIVEGNLKSIENRLKAQGLKVLREGGGIGAITEKEWDILANQVANIDRSKGSEYVKGELAKVQATMIDMQRNAMQRHSEQFGSEYLPDRTKVTPSAQPAVQGKTIGGTSEVWERGPDGKLRRAQ